MEPSVPLIILKRSSLEERRNKGYKKRGTERMEKSLKTFAAAKKDFLWAKEKCGTKKSMQTFTF